MSDRGDILSLGADSDGKIWEFYKSNQSLLHVHDTGIVTVLESHSQTFEVPAHSLVLVVGLVIVEPFTGGFLQYCSAGDSADKLNYISSSELSVIGASGSYMTHYESSGNYQEPVYYSTDDSIIIEAYNTGGSAGKYRGFAAYLPLNSLIKTNI